MANALPHPNLFATFPCVTMDFVGGGGCRSHGARRGGERNLKMGIWWVHHGSLPTAAFEKPLTKEKEASSSLG